MKTVLTLKNKEKNKKAIVVNQLLKKMVERNC